MKKMFGINICAVILRTYDVNLQFQTKPSKCGVYGVPHVISSPSLSRIIGSG